MVVRGGEAWFGVWLDWTGLGWIRLDSESGLRCGSKGGGECRWRRMDGRGRGLRLTNDA